MVRKKLGVSIRKRTLSQIAFFLALSLILGIILLYAHNIIEWAEHPDFGFYRRVATGIHDIGVVTEPGRRAGIKAGDHVLRVNGKTFGNMSEFRSALNWKIGEKNIYLLERMGQQFEVTISNTHRLGVKATFIKSGLLLLEGLCYGFIGIVVFLLKPHRRVSWIFFLSAVAWGLRITFLFNSGPLSPSWLGTAEILFQVFTPAALIHLALIFPEERKVLKKHPFIQFLLYLPAAVLMLAIRSTTPEMLGIPKVWFVVQEAYLWVAVSFFLGSCLQLRLSSKSEMVKLRSRMILLGAAISASLPLLDALVHIFFHRYLVPNLNYYLPFLVICPLFIAYSIIRHNLFDFDGFIKRTYGYILVTIGISGIYVLFLLLLNKVLELFEMAGSPVFPLLFIISVVFLFNPIRNRAQTIINRAFFRLEYDYQAIIHKISETMRSLSSLDQIGKSILDTALDDLYIDSGRIFFLNRERQVYECLTRASGGKDPATFLSRSNQTVPANDPLLEKMEEKKEEATWYHIQEDPFYGPAREACERSFKLLGATLLVPIIYEDNMTGFIALGNKKSGKYYGREDKNLLKTLANQGAIAIENARLAEQMKNEERIRTNLARYISPQVVDQIIKNNVQVNLGGDKKVVTVLFSDIRNFTRIAEILPPDQLMKLLNEYFTEMARIIFANQGSLEQYIGDALVAIFGGLISLHNPAQSAVRTAIEMIKCLESANQRWTTQYGFAIYIGIGINTGEVLLGNVGSPERMEFTVIGDTVNIAARFSVVARPGQILVTKDTVTHLGSDINYLELTPVEVKGKTGKLKVFEIVCS